MPTALIMPPIDPTPLFEAYRGNYSTELLTAAVAHFDLFRRLANEPMTEPALGHALGLAPRPAIVLIVAMRAMKLLELDPQQRLIPTPLARECLVPDAPFYIGDYLALSADAPGVKAMVQRLRSNGASAGDDAPQPSDAPPPTDPTQFIYRDGAGTSMEQEASARRLTLALAGRAKVVAPALARNVPLPDARRLLDVGGGSGIYALAMLHANPDLRAVVWDRPEVLRVAREFARAQGLADRVEFESGDMFTDLVPRDCDVMLLSNVLHDWDAPQCEALLDRCAAALAPGGQLLIHDVFLDDAMDGPLPVALYSAALFSVTEGRAYSAAEYRAFLDRAGLETGAVIPTLVHCGVLPARKR